MRRRTGAQRWISYITARAEISADFDVGRRRTHVRVRGVVFKLRCEILTAFGAPRLGRVVFFCQAGGPSPPFRDLVPPPLPPSLGPAGEMRRPPPTPKKCILVCPYASSLGLKARQNTPAFDAAIYRPYSTSYTLQPSFHTSSTEPEPTARARRAGKEFY